MTIIVADIGGTNSRLACASRQGVVEASIRRFKNSAYESFEDILVEYLRAENVKSVSACGVAVAGPITDRQARLTNLDWEISEDLLRRVMSCDQARLLNDLSALGLSLNRLPSNGVERLTGREGGLQGDSQMLVVGVGTGFNVCPVLATPDEGAICLQAEVGHAHPPKRVLDTLASRIGPEVSKLSIIEEIFSGRGLSKMFAIATNGEALDAESVVAAHCAGIDDRATRVLGIYATALGMLCQDLALHYLPRRGIYLAGSVARGVLSAGFASEFVAGFLQSSKFDNQLNSIPVSIIREDAAALIGCLEAVCAPSARLSDPQAQAEKADPLGKGRLWVDETRAHSDASANS